MLARTFIDPQEDKRRRLLRARIIRRNRINKEISQGLTPKLRRAPRLKEPTLDEYGWDPTQDKGDSPFFPTFGGNSDQSRHQRDHYVVGQARISHQSKLQEALVPNVLTTKDSNASFNSSASSENADGEHKSPSTDADVFSKTNNSTSPPLPLHIVRSARLSAPSKPVNSQVRTRWQEAYRAIVFKRHDEILAKDPNRKWRQERFGLLLFDKKDYKAATKHLVQAVILGATSSTCWRRLAQCYFRMWEDGGDWDLLWDSKAAYEQAMDHLEITCNPYALFEYARVLEALGNYSGGLSVCASILQTFPHFQQLHEIMYRFVLLQRYQIFSASASSDLTAPNSMDSKHKVALLTKCIEYTKILLLDKTIAEGEYFLRVLYTHARLNELLAESTISDSVAAKLAVESANQSFEELYKAAYTHKMVPSCSGMTWKVWKVQSDTYLTWAKYFQAHNEEILASDALSRALELLDSPLSSTLRQNARTETPQQIASKISLYLILGQHYYQCNQMERAIRSMEAIFQIDPFHNEMRANLIEWFPDKWKYRLELEEASQVQIARIVRGMWGRSKALEQKQHAQRRAEAKYLEHPFHPWHRRNVLRLLREKYGPLFAAQDLAARRIQQAVKKYLGYARTRWALADRKNKFLRDLISKYQTRKYRYNRSVREQLVRFLPDEYEYRFLREDNSALRIQCWFRGERVRRPFYVRREEYRANIKHHEDAAYTLKRFFMRYCTKSANDNERLDGSLFQIQQQIAIAKKRIAKWLQSRYRHWKTSTKSVPLIANLLQVDDSNSERRRSAIIIEHAWCRRISVESTDGMTINTPHESIQQTQGGHRQTDFEAQRFENAVSKIQALYRGKRIRNSLAKVRRQLAPLSPSSIFELMDKLKENDRHGVEGMVLLQAIDSIEEKRALFDHAVVILQPEKQSLSNNQFTSLVFPLQHVVSAIEHSSLLRCLICTGGYFTDDRLISLLRALQQSRSLRVFALGAIQIAPSPQLQTKLQNHDVERVFVLPERGEENNNHLSVKSSMGPKYRTRKTEQCSSPLKRQHDKVYTSDSQSTPMTVLSEALRTTNFLLEELYLEDNLLLVDPLEGTRVAQFVGDYFFGRYGHLTKLVLARMQFSDANAALLGTALAINTVLRYLDLHGNAIGDDAAVTIAKTGLIVNKTLVYLNLAENSIGTTGAKAFFHCLTHQNVTLKELILRNNNVRNDAVAELYQVWTTNPTIEVIDLTGNLIHSDHLTLLHAVIEERQRLSSAASSDLRLFLAKKRFGALLTPPNTNPSYEPQGTALSPLKATKKQKKSIPLSPKKWLQANAKDNSTLALVCLHSPYTRTTASNSVTNTHNNRLISSKTSLSPTKKASILPKPPRKPSATSLPELAPIVVVPHD